MRVGDLFAALHLDKRSFSAGLATARAESTGLGTLIGKIGLGMGLAFAAVGAIAINMAADFQKSMANVHTLIGKGSESDARIVELGEAIKGMSMETGKSLEDLSGGLYEVIGTFGDGADTLGLLDVAARAGSAGLSTTQDAVRLLAALTKSYGDTSVEAAQHSADLAFQTANLGVTTFPEMAQAMGRVIPTAAALKISQEELFAVMATLTGVTGSTDEVTTQLRGSMTAMLKPSREMRDALKELGYTGVSAGQDIVGEKGLVPSIQMLAGTTTAGKEGIAKLWRNTNTLNAVLALTGGQADTFATKMAAMGDVTGVTTDAFNIQHETVAEMQNRVSAAIGVMMVDLGEKLLPIVETVLNWIIDNWPAIAGVFDSVATAIGRTVQFVVLVIAKLIEVIDFLKPAIIAIGTVIMAVMLPSLVAMAVSAGAAALAMALAFAIPAAVVVALIATLAAASAAVNFFAMDFGEMGAKMHDVATKTSVDFNQVKEVTRALMDEYGLSFEEAAARAETALASQGAAYDEAAVHAEAATGRQTGATEATASATETATTDIETSIAEMEAVIAAETEAAGLAMSEFSREALTALQELETGMRDSGTAAASAWLDPIKTGLEIAQAEAELGSKELRDKLKSKDPDIVRDGQIRKATLISQLIGLKNEAALQGDATAQVAKTKALLASEFMEEGLASKDDEIVATFELWRDEMDERVAEMEATASNADIGRNLAAAITAQSSEAYMAAGNMAAKIRGIFPGSEPKDPSSPFRGITKGFGIGSTLAEGFGASLRGHDFAGLFGNSMPSAAGGGGAGGGSSHVTVEIRDPDGAIRGGGYDQGQIERVVERALMESVSGARHRSLRMAPG